MTALDALFEVNGEAFGWDYPVNPGPRYTVCEDVGGAGSGSVGIYVSSILTAGGAAFRRKHLGTLVHESIHLWDFRGELHTQGPDTVHVLTGTMETYVQRLRDWGTIGAYNDSIIEVGGQTFERMATSYFLARYLGDPSASWDTYFNPSLMSMNGGEIAATVDVPEVQERIYMQSGFLSAIRDMHGPEGLRAYFEELDLLLVKNPSWASMTLSTEHRLDNFFVALTRALQTDVSPYFDYWKISITEAQRAYAAQFPASRMLSDGDGDGFSPLEGDIDDCDAAVYPNAPELQDGLDNNQDGQTDEHVYAENGLGDLDSASIELPARIVGDIPSQADTDELRFTAPTDTIVAIVVHPGQAHTPAPYAPGDTRLSRVYLGTVAVGSWHLLSNPPWMSGAGLPINYRSTGDEIVLRLDALDRADANGVPGRYELQIVPEGHASAPWDVETLLQEILPN